MNNKPGRGRFIMRQTYTLAGPYTYLRDLQALERACMPELQGSSSPLTGHLLHWRRALAAHPDRAFAMYVLNGIEHYFRVGFAHGSPLTPTLHNMHPAALHPEAIDSYIGTETQEGRMLGPFPPGRIRGLHINRMGVVPNGGSSLISRTRRVIASTMGYTATCILSSKPRWRQWQLLHRN